MTSGSGHEIAIVMPSVPQQIGRLFAEGTLAGLSDAELLGRFASGRDAVAFDALVARHGPMVLGVCRGLLSDPNDAEDAFQATFLILVRKAGTFRGPVALGGWLYLAARRVAIRANVAAARRRAHERRAAQMAKMTSEPGPSARDELLSALHEEIARLPKEMTLAGREGAFMGRYPQATQLVGATFDYIAGPTKPITGVVRLKGSGKPVEGAIVGGVDPATHTMVTARTDAAGAYRLEGVPKGEFYQIRVTERPGIDPFLRNWEIIDDTEGLKPIVATVEVPPGVIVVGRLVDKATGRAVPPLVVQYLKAAENATSTDDKSFSGFSPLADAAFGLTVPPGPGIICAAAAVAAKDDPYVRARLDAADRAKGFDDSYDRFLGDYSAYKWINAPADAGPVALDFPMARGLGRAGRLSGPDGRPVVGAFAYGLSGRNPYYRQTLESSTFDVGGLEPGHPRLVVFAHEARKLVGSVVLKDEDLRSATPLEVKLVPAGTLTGRLVDDDGLPWAGAKIHSSILDLDGRNFPEGDGMVAADAGGRFRVDGFVPGVQTLLFLEAGNRPNVFLDGGMALGKPALEAGEVRDLGDVKVKEIAQ